MRSKRLKEGIWAASVAVAATLPFLDILLGGLNLYIRDIARGYFPQRHLLAEVLRSGEMPFWNPLISAGQPLAANPAYFAFYPLQWLMALGDYRDMFHFVVVAHYPLAAVGMYLLARSLGIGRPVAALGGLAFALGGTMLSLSNLLPFEFALAWLPWLTLFFRRYVVGGRLVDLAATTLILGIILLIGEVAMILQAGGLIAIYAVARSLRRDGSGRRAMIGLLIAVSGATLIGAVQILPALEHKADSGRAEPLPYEAISHWSTHPLRPLEAVWPTLFGSPGEESWTYWGGPLLFGREDTLPWLLHLYPGFLLTVMALSGLIGGVRGWRLTLVFAAGSFLLALGYHTPLFRLLYESGFTLVRYPEKFIVIAIFVLTLFALVSAEAATRDSRLRRIATVVAAVFAGLSLVLLAATWHPRFLDGFMAVFDLSRRDAALVDVFRTGMARSAILMVLAAFLLGTRPRIPDRTRLTLLGFLLVIDLGVRVPSVMPRITADYYTPPPAAAILMAERPAPRIYSHANWQRLNEPHPAVPFGLRHWVLRNGILPESHQTWGLQGVLEPDVSIAMLKPTIEFNHLFDAFRTARRMDRFPLLMQMAGTSHIGLLQPLDPEVVRDSRRFDEVDPVEFVPTRNAGRYYFATVVREAADFVEVGKILGSEEPLDARTAFVHGEVFTPAAGRVLSIREGFNEIELAVEADGHALLLLAVTPHRYWQATIDDQPASLERANVGFQALRISQGSHRVVMRYRNTTVIRSATVSLLATAVFVLLLAFSLLRHGRNAARGEGEG